MSVSIVYRAVALASCIGLLLAGCSADSQSTTVRTEHYGGLVVFLETDSTTANEGLNYRVENRTTQEWSLIMPVQLDAADPSGGWVAIPDPQGNRVRQRRTGELFTLEPGDATPWRPLVIDQHEIEPGRHRVRLPMRESAEHSRIDLVAEFTLER